MKAIYALTAPHQTVSLRIAKGENETVLTEVTLTPGKPCELPDDHKFTLKMIEAGYLLDDKGEPIKLDEKKAAALEAEEKAKRDAHKTPAALGALPKLDPKRIDAIGAALAEIGKDDVTSQGQPKVSRVSELVGFKVHPDEIDAAVKATGWKPTFEGEQS